MLHLKNYINGEFCEPESGKWLDNYNPATGEIYSKIPDSGSEDIEEAVKAAKAAFPKWSNTPIDERSKILMRISNIIEKNLVELAEAESKDNGKPLSLALSVDIPRAASNFAFYAHAITQFSSESHEKIYRIDFRH